MRPALDAMRSEIDRLAKTIHPEMIETLKRHAEMIEHEYGDIEIDRDHWQNEAHGATEEVEKLEDIIAAHDTSAIKLATMLHERGHHRGSVGLCDREPCSTVVSFLRFEKIDLR